MATKDQAAKIVTLDDTPTQSNPEQAAPVLEIVGANYDDALSGVKEKIEIFEQDIEGGKDAVFVQVNGYAYQIPRNTICVIPVEVLWVIEAAKFTVYSRDGDKVAHRDVKRFAYTKHGTVG